MAQHAIDAQGWNISWGTIGYCVDRGLFGKLCQIISVKCHWNTIQNRSNIPSETPWNTWIFSPWRWPHMSIAHAGARTFGGNSPPVLHPCWSHCWKAPCEPLCWTEGAIKGANLFWSMISMVGGLEHVFFQYIWNNHPNWLICFRGVETTNQFPIDSLWKMGSRLELLRVYQQSNSRKHRLDQQWFQGFNCFCCWVPRQLLS